MKFQRPFALLLFGFLLCGCNKPITKTAAVAPTVESSLPTEAQPKLPTIKLWVGPEEISAELARYPKQIETGMMFRTNIAETDAMIFILALPQRASFWMKNCPESISAAYIDPAGVIQEIHHLEQQDTNAVVAASNDIYYVLETKDGWFERHQVRTGMVIRTDRGSLGEVFHQRN